MKALHFQAVGGASGDMILAALLDLGADPEGLQTALQSLKIGPIRLRTSPAASHGLHGLQVEFQTPDADGNWTSADAAPAAHTDGHASGHAHAHPHKHESDGASHSHSHPGPSRASDHDPAHTAGHEHRSFREICRILGDSGLSDPVRERSLCVFARLAEAEGRVHGISAEDVRFHEVGAIDSIADIVGACWALESLGVERVSFDPLPLGTGTVKCAHGVYPVPAPAVVELLKGIPVIGGGEPGERVTPTGAALLSVWRTDPVCPSGRIVGSGLGFGHRAGGSGPNVLRALQIDLHDTAGNGADTVLALETHLDDATPELIGSLFERLFAAGALDVTATPTMMKKQRPGILLTVLCEPDRREAFLDRIFRESGTFGIRETEVRRARLDRRIERVRTPYGEVRVKIGIWHGHIVARKPEFDDCSRCSIEAGVSLRTVQSAALRASEEVGRPDSGSSFECAPAKQ
ncbi:MAG: nickel pincer cofactor biosynthesis protein LarC [Kiritimatiellia bacterium]|nr:nickel pincer cofactor biosynthesis protein LarC [Kiritimatiellia bacterium]